MTRLGELEQAEAILNDWAAYLHARPGLRAAWESWERRLSENRRLLTPESEATFGWAEALRSKFEVLDRAEN